MSNAPPPYTTTPVLADVGQVTPAVQHLSLQDQHNPPLSEYENGNEKTTSRDTADIADSLENARELSGAGALRLPAVIPRRYTLECA